MNSGRNLQWKLENHSMEIKFNKNLFYRLRFNGSVEEGADEVERGIELCTAPFKGYHKDDKIKHSFEGM